MNTKIERSAQHATRRTVKMPVHFSAQRQWTIRNLLVLAALLTHQ